MHSEPAIENRTAGRGRRRKSGNGSNGAADGPVFVDNSGRRAKLLRRFGTFLGVVCLGYAAVLGMAFMGWGTSLTPSSLLPFGGNGPGGIQGPGGQQPQGGIGAAPSGAPTGAAVPPAKPSGTPPTGVATGEPPASAPTATASASAAAN
ncbi:hypothetical protein ACH4TV_24975 [Streptomyces sp. NPDC020898]|uniref:hypothetical protein n=1 Tax=Streptomyces sp. NPDC020898 TaxID=3365101 RepID=UPI0037BA57FB